MFVRVCSSIVESTQLALIHVQSAVERSVQTVAALACLSFANVIRHVHVHVQVHVHVHNARSVLLRVVFLPVQFQYRCVMCCMGSSYTPWYCQSRR